MPRVFNKEFLANKAPAESESNAAGPKGAVKDKPEEKAEFGTKTTLREVHNKLNMSDLMGQELGQLAKDKAAKAEEVKVQNFDSNEAIGSVYMFMQGLRGIMQMLIGMGNGRNQQR